MSSYDDSDIVELEIIQSEPLSATRLKQLRKSFACISNIALVHSENFEGQVQRRSRKLMSDEELFREFYKGIRGFEPNSDLVNLFLECRGGEDETN